MLCNKHESNSIYYGCCRAIGGTCDENADAVDPNNRKQDSNKTRKDTWNNIAATLNGEFPSLNTDGEKVSKKWSNLKSKAKQKQQDKKR